MEVLERGLPPAQTGSNRHDADVVVGPTFRDDAAVVRPTAEGKGLVLTCDVITPIVDDPRTFGRIAAANALSDVYAMGGVPRHALNLVFFPDKKLALHVLDEVLAGGACACAEAGAVVVGGHTVRDAEIKYGMSVTGEVELSRVWSNRNAQPGQVLVLTKALGTGLVAGARKRHRAGDIPEVVGREDLEHAIASMQRLNRVARDIAVGHPVTAATDVTGFGLLGHLGNITRGSQVRARVRLSALPALPGALGAARHGIVPGGTRANLEFLQTTGAVEIAEGCPEEQVWLAADAQTSGGLLLCIDADASNALMAQLRAAGQVAEVVGELEAVTPERPVVIVVEP